MKRRIALAALIAAIAALPAMAQAAAEEDALTVYAYDSFSGEWGRR